MMQVQWDSMPGSATSTQGQESLLPGILETH